MTVSLRASGDTTYTRSETVAIASTQDTTTTVWSSNASVRKNPVSTQLRIPSIASGTSMSTESIANSILTDDNSVRNVNPVVTSSGTPVVTCSGIVSSAPARVRARLRTPIRTLRKSGQLTYVVARTNCVRRRKISLSVKLRFVRRN